MRLEILYGIYFVKRSIQIFSIQSSSGLGFGCGLRFIVSSILQSSIVQLFVYRGSSRGSYGVFLNSVVVGFGMFFGCRVFFVFLEI